MKTLLLKLIRFYQRLSFSTHPTCRFTPTCSNYSYQAISKYGIVRGSFLGLKRIIKCHPWSKGGLDKLP